jgi:hypothetical protein
VTLHGIVIAFLLLFPWGLIGVTFLGIALEHVQRARRFRRRERSVPPLLQSQRQEMHMSGLPADDVRVPQVQGGLRKAA